MTILLEKQMPEILEQMHTFCCVREVTEKRSIWYKDIEELFTDWILCQLSDNLPESLKSAITNSPESYSIVSAAENTDMFDRFLPEQDYAE